MSTSKNQFYWYFKIDNFYNSFFAMTFLPFHSMYSPCFVQDYTSNSSISFCKTSFFYSIVPGDLKTFKSMKNNRSMDWSPDLGVMGRDSRCEGRKFESRYIYWMDIFHIPVCCKSCHVCLKRTKRKKKRPGLAHFLKKEQIQKYWDNCLIWMTDLHKINRQRRRRQWVQNRWQYWSQPVWPEENR